MASREIRSSKAPAPGGAYSQALRVGDFVFVSGSGPFDPLSGEVVGHSIAEQTEQTLKNIGAILEAAGARMADVVKATVHLSDLDLFPEFNRVYAQAFPDPKPTRTTVGSQLLGILVEIDVIAYTGSE